MGHVVFGGPSIASFVLLERLRRELLRRGHRVSVLCLDPQRFTFWREQLAGVDLIEAAAPQVNGVPCADLAQRSGHRTAGTARRLARLTPGLLRWWDRERPDLVLLHGERGPHARLAEFIGRSRGTNVLWTGPGLLPHTLQVDERGLDGDASCLRSPPSAYRVVRPEPALLAASLANVLGGAEPVALPTARIAVPPLRRRLADACAQLFAGDPAGAVHAVRGWHDAAPPPFSRGPDLVRWCAPADPFVAVLLQSSDDERLLLDGADAPPPAELLARACAAAAGLDPRWPVVAVLPAGARTARQMRHARRIAGFDRVQLAPAEAAAIAAATAVATITVNHPAGIISLLSGTPVLHVGRALYGLPGVTTTATGDGLAEALPDALRRDRPALRRRFLTWLLRHGHLWCSAIAPNHNGMFGLVHAVERRLDSRSPRPIPYKPGPAWPLATEHQERLGR